MGGAGAESERDFGTVARGEVGMSEVRKDVEDVRPLTVVVIVAVAML